MNAERLLDVYEQISEAPDAIARLRRFVLDLAVRGKLVEQDAADEPSLQHLLSLDEITGKGRKLLTPLTSSEAGAETPSSWHWLRLGAIIRGMDAGWSPQCEPHPRESEDQWGVLKTTAVQALSFSPEQHKLLPEKLKPRPELQAEIGDILVTRAGPKNRVGVSCVVDVPCPKLMISDKLIRFHTYGALEPRYIALTLNAGISLAHIEDAKSGMAVMQMNISQAKLRAVPIPLPPLAEQHRIVAKVDELMALCDRLEEARKTREEVRDKLTAASLARLTAPDTTAQAEPAKVGTGFASGSATSEDDFPTHAAFALEALPALTTRPDQIKTLRQTILNLAVRGKLVEQDPADEPASELLKVIEQRREEYLADDYPNQSEAKTQRKKQKQQVVPPGLESLPVGWCWTTLQQSSLMVIDCKNKTAPYSAKGIRLIRTTNVRDGKMNSNDQKFVTETTYEAWSLRGKPQPGDILITREAPMGEVCIIPDGEQICLGQRMMLARLVPETIDPRFMLYSLRDPDLMDRVQDKPIGMTVQHLRVGGVETLLVPLPPLAEQHRIVAKVDALMALCDRLEAALTTTDTTRARLLEALLHEALEPAADLREAAE